MAPVGTLTPRATSKVKPLRVFVACEFSGTVRDAFLRAGHYAISADLEPSETAYGEHIQGDALEVLQHQEFDLLIAHPPCQYLANSGVRWLYQGGERYEPRWEALASAAEFFRSFLEAPVPRICIENPIMHGHGRKLIGATPTQIIQPWQFGHGETKATGLYLRGLPLLQATNIVDGREARVHRMAPGPNRTRERSRFYKGIADAMATQWGERN